MFGKTNHSGLDALLNRPPPTAWQRFIEKPCLFLAKLLCSRRHSIPMTPVSPVIVQCISDTHNRQPEIPPGEILIHAGDLTQSGTFGEVQKTIDWLKSLPHRYKIVIAGNHDIILDDEHQDADSAAARLAVDWGDVIYLKNESVTVSCQNGRNLNIYGSPYTPRHGNWAFQYPRGQDVWKDRVPPNTDILITHSPPKSHLDLDQLGCQFLLDEIWSKRPRLHVFGHIHAGYGKEWVHFDSVQEAYETIAIAGGGFLNLLRLASKIILASFGHAKESRALLVNASTVGGVRDEKIRPPITVHV